MESAVSSLTVFTVMSITILCFGIGLWIAKTYLISTKPEENNIGKITLGNLTTSENKIRIDFTSDGDCGDCVAEFNTVIKYSDNRTKVVRGTAEPESKMIEFILTRYDSSSATPVSVDVNSYLVNTIDKRGIVTRKSYSIIRS
jgi:hypothetical protein